MDRLVTAAPEPVTRLFGPGLGKGGEVDSKAWPLRLVMGPQISGTAANRRMIQSTLDQLPLDQGNSQLDTPEGVVATRDDRAEFRLIVKE